MKNEKLELEILEVSEICVNADISEGLHFIRTEAIALTLAQCTNVRVSVFEEGHRVREITVEYERILASIRETDPRTPAPRIG